MRRCDNVGMHDLVIRGGKVVDGTGATPVTADVAIDGDQVVAVGQVDQTGRREVEADGALVAPGWVDVHTHYDGQATWDPVMRPSIDHGVTTAVMGNCGVGFAPVRPGGEAFLIELMEAIEDIPGTALHEGIDWRWETFGEYINALAEMPRTLDLGTTVPHAAVRAYVLGDRCHEYDVDAAEIGEIARVMADGVRAGALGVSTSRTIQHRSRHGYEPGTFALDEELMAIADELAGVGRGLFQFVSDKTYAQAEWEWLEHLQSKGVNVTYTLAQDPGAPEAYLANMDANHAATLAGTPTAPQVPTRPTGLLYGLGSRRCIPSGPTRATARSPTVPTPSASQRCVTLRSGPASWPRSPRPRTASSGTWSTTSPRCSGSAIRPTTSRRRSRALRPSPSARAVRRRKSSTTGCSKTTARR